MGFTSLWALHCLVGPSIPYARYACSPSCKAKRRVNTFCPWNRCSRGASLRRFLGVFFHGFSSKVKSPSAISCPKRLFGIFGAPPCKYPARAAFPASFWCYLASRVGFRSKCVGCLAYLISTKFGKHSEKKSQWVLENRTHQECMGGP